jgi:hypothetical protein
MFERPSKRRAREIENAQDDLRDLSQALEGNLDVYKVVVEYGAPYSLLFIPAGINPGEYQREHGIPGLVPLSIVSEKFTQEELWTEFEKLSERI